MIELFVKTYAREFHFKWGDKDEKHQYGGKLLKVEKDYVGMILMSLFFIIDLENLRSFKSSAEESDFFDKIINRLIELNGGNLLSKTTG